MLLVAINTVISKILVILLFFCSLQLLQGKASDYSHSPFTGVGLLLCFTAVQRKSILEMH